MKTTFKQTINFLSKIDTISCGGCGVAALTLYHAAKKEGKEPKIYFIYSNWDDESIKTNEAFIEGKKKKATSCFHIVLKIGRRYYDGEGVVDISKYSYHKIIETPLIVLESAICNKGVWNPTFDREKYIPMIEDFIGIKLVKKSLIKRIMKSIKKH